MARPLATSSAGFYYHMQRECHLHLCLRYCCIRRGKIIQSCKIKDQSRGRKMSLTNDKCCICLAGRGCQRPYFTISLFCCSFLQVMISVSDFFFFRSNVVALSLRTRVRKCHISIPRTSYCNGYSHVILKARVNSLSHKRILK